MKRAALTVLIISTLIGCGHKKRPRRVPAPPTARTAPIPRPVGSTETGLASWYGQPYHGRTAANGETYDMEKLTAAHKTLPFETWVRVTNLANNQEVEVRITDRGPFVEGRIIDLSHAAAQAIELIGPGVAKVRLTVIKAPVSAGLEAARFAVQVGAFRSKESAERIRATMAQHYGAAQLVRRDGNPVVWRVLAGSLNEEAEATVLAERIRAENADHRAAFVVRLDP